MIGRLYIGSVRDPMGWRVLVDPGDGGRQFEINPRLDIANHSPTGLSWGYQGSGPAQTALAILCDAVGVELAMAHYQRFKAECIATLPQDAGWTMRHMSVVLWVGQAESKSTDR